MPGAGAHPAAASAPAADPPAADPPAADPPARGHLAAEAAAAAETPAPARQRHFPEFLCDLYRRRHAMGLGAFLSTRSARDLYRRRHALQMLVIAYAVGTAFRL